MEGSTARTRPRPGLRLLRLLGALLRGLGGLLPRPVLLSRRDLPKDALDPDGPLLRIVDRRLHDPHEDGPPAGRLVGFDHVQRPAGPEDTRVVLSVFPSEVLGEEVEVRLPEELLDRLAHRLAVLAVGEDDAAFDILSEEILGQAVDQRTVHRLRPADLILRLKVGAEVTEDP